MRICDACLSGDHRHAGEDGCCDCERSPITPEQDAAITRLRDFCEGMASIGYNLAHGPADRFPVRADDIRTLLGTIGRAP